MRAAMKRHLTIRCQAFPLKRDFRISRGSRTTAEVVTVEVRQDGAVGRGEATPNIRYGETQESTAASVESLRNAIEAGLSRDELQERLSAGAARNALDCALWDLQAKLEGKSIWQLLGRKAPDRILTAYTISLGSPAEMAEEAAGFAEFPLLKLKLGGDGDIARLEAVRTALPSTRLIADANEAAERAGLQALVDCAAELGVEMVEQPLPAGAEAMLGYVDRKVPICADEACHVTSDLARLGGLYDMVNIKLDKTGGLTEALRLEREARRQGFGIMVGCMVSTSLGLAPAQVVAAQADLVDLDAGLYFAAERDPAIPYDGASMSIASPQVWG